MSTSLEETRALLHELLGRVCFCGAKKRARQTFCRACFFRLPKPLATPLYHRFGQAYEEAYAEARRFLGLESEP